MTSTDVETIRALDPRTCKLCPTGEAGCIHCTGGPLRLSLMPDDLGEAFRFVGFDYAATFLNERVALGSDRYSPRYRVADPKAKAKRKAQRQARRVNRRA